jgi:hypothetical protein
LSPVAWVRERREKGNSYLSKEMLSFPDAARGSKQEQGEALLAMESDNPGHVFGLPRVDFAEVSRRVRSSRTNPGLLVKPLPYEIIIQGVYRDAK